MFYYSQPIYYTQINLGYTDKLIYTWEKEPSVLLQLPNLVLLCSHSMYFPFHTFYLSIFYYNQFIPTLFYLLSYSQIQNSYQILVPGTDTYPNSKTAKTKFPTSNPSFKPSFSLLPLLLSLSFHSLLLLSLPSTHLTIPPRQWPPMD